MFRAFADVRRLRILHLLREREMCVADLVEVLGLPQSTVSRQLGILRDAGLIVDSYLAADVAASQKKDLLLPSVMTFLAAEGVRGVYRIEGNDDAPSLPQQCGAAIERIAQQTEVALLFRTLRFHKQFETMPDPAIPEDDDARLGVD